MRGLQLQQGASGFRGLGCLLMFAGGGGVCWGNIGPRLTGCWGCEVGAVFLKQSPWKNPATLRGFTSLAKKYIWKPRPEFSEIRCVDYLHAHCQTEFRKSIARLRNRNNTAVVFKSEKQTFCCTDRLGNLPMQKCRYYKGWWSLQVEFLSSGACIRGSY